MTGAVSMRAKIAQRHLDRQMAAPEPADEQLRTALSNCHVTLQHTLNVHDSRVRAELCAPVVVARVFCELAEIPQRPLLCGIVSRYFCLRDKPLITVADFADAFPSLAWALCYASTERLMRYMVELYADDGERDGFTKIDTFAAVFADMYALPDQHKHRSLNQVEIITDEILEYTTAVHPCTPAPKRSSGHKSTLSTSTAPIPVFASPEEDEHLAAQRKNSLLTEENVGSPKPLDVVLGSSSWLAENMQFVRRASRDDAHDAEEEEATVASYSEASDDACVHIDTAMRYLKIHPKRLWPLFTFQAHLRSVLFGDKYWRRITADAAEKPTVVQFQRSIMEMTEKLQELYVPDRSAKCASKRISLRRAASLQRMPSSQPASSSPSSAAADVHHSQPDAAASARIRARLWVAKVVARAFRRSAREAAASRSAASSAASSATPVAVAVSVR